MTLLDRLRVLLADALGASGSLGTSAWERVELKHDLAEANGRAARFEEALKAEFAAHLHTRVELHNAERSFAELSATVEAVKHAAYRAGAEEMAALVKQGRDPDEVLATARRFDEIRDSAHRMEN